MSLPNIQTSNNETQPNGTVYYIAVTGGGSGGHVYPALAVLQRLHQLVIEEQPDVALCVLWLGSRRGIEKDILSQVSGQAANLPNLTWKYCGISCGKLRRSLSLASCWQNFRDLFCTARGVWQSYRILRHHKPCLLFSKGGFVTVPGLLAARILGIPALAHESDLDPGLATRLALPLVQTLFLPYEQSCQYYTAKYQHKLQVSGNPVRAEFFSDFYAKDAQLAAQLASSAIPPHWLDDGGSLRRPLLLVLGGSLGASELNRYVAQWLGQQNQEQGLSEELGVEPSNFTENFPKDFLGCSYYILHQCGQNDYPSIQEKFQKLPMSNDELRTNYHVLPFISVGLGAVYQLCRESGGAVISRAGAGSLWEILASGNRAVLVPLQPGSRGDQLRNAQFFAKQGWADCFIAAPNELNQRNGEKLLEQVRLILQDEILLNCIRPSVPNAALHIAQSIWRQIQSSR